MTSDWPENPVIWCEGPNCDITCLDTDNCWVWIIIDNPDAPEPGCSGPNCNNICVWNVNNCWWIVIDNPNDPEPGCLSSDCNNICVWNINNCQINESPDGLYGTRSGWVWPFSVTARCSYDSGIVNHSWSNIIWHEFSFAGYFPSVCPCEPCHRYVTDSNGLMSSIGTFQVCDNSCINNPEPEDDCNWDINCEACRPNPELCGAWSGWVWPFSVTARCSYDSGVVNHSWSNIIWHEFSFAGYFPSVCPCEPCHRYVTDSNGLRSPIGVFQVCDNSCINNSESENNCHWDPECELCLLNPESCWTWSWWVWPYSVTAWCEPENIIYDWYNIMWNNFSFNGLLPWACPCKKCHWYVQDSIGNITNTRDFQVCNDWCWMTSDWPEDPVIWCTWSNCNNVCTWDVNNCTWCNWDPYVYWILNHVECGHDECDHIQ